MLECPTGIQGEKEHVVALVVTFQVGTIDLGIASIQVRKASSKGQALAH